ncbi:LysR family transcriptional regulator [Leucobacter massiliensis]|uniref:LysR family transcriptional regulator n=1 Tax=Leucobacter massiliensis TaxID=1686285 RepID=A0A2S9QL90_9MICO|nr:LysR family transcriptional regulator [Leucobacter massiliensis]PRI10350.1 LysR family transcriptional regulator [Leucobacter massiliensis]
MNLEQLRGFAEVAQSGHFTRAAERLHLAQPSLSRQIAGLERELGVELFHRLRGNVTLTRAGERLLPIARRMLADAEAAREEMAELAGLRRGRVRLGATPTLCTSLVSEVLAEYRARHPGIEIEILERGSRSLISALTEGALDLALIVTSVSSGAARAALESEAILGERLVVVSSVAAPDPFGSGGDGEVPPGAPEAPAPALGGPRAGAVVRAEVGARALPGAVGLRELAGVPQVRFPENYDLRVAVDAAFAAAGLTPSVAVEGAEMDAALSFAERGIGVAVVPAMVAAERPLLRARPIADGLRRTISLARRADMSPTHASAALQALIRETADRLAASGSPVAHLVERA